MNPNMTTFIAMGLMNQSYANQRMRQQRYNRFFNKYGTRDTNSHKPIRTKEESQFDLFVLGELLNNEEIKPAILNYIESHDKIVARNRAEIIERINNLAPQIEAVYNKSVEQLEEIENMGFAVDFSFLHDKDYNKDVVFPSSENEKGYEHKRVKVPKSINGIDVTSGVFNYENPYKIPLQEFLKENSDIDNELEKINEKIKKLKKNFISLLFNKQKSDELLNLEIAREKYLNKQERLKELQEKADFYERLNANQKATIKSFLQNVEEIKELSTKAQEYLFADYCLDKNAEKVNAEDILKYYRELTKYVVENLTEEDIATISNCEDQIANKITTLSPEQKKEIIESVQQLENPLQIAEKNIDEMALYAISDMCYAKTKEVVAAVESSKSNDGADRQQ